MTKKYTPIIVTSTLMLALGLCAGDAAAQYTVTQIPFASNDSLTKINAHGMIAGSGEAWVPYSTNGTIGGPPAQLQPWTQSSLIAMGTPSVPGRDINDLGAIVQDYYASFGCDPYGDVCGHGWHVHKWLSSAGFTTTYWSETLYDTNGITAIHDHSLMDFNECSGAGPTPELRATGPGGINNNGIIAVNVTPGDGYSGTHVALYAGGVSFAQVPHPDNGIAQDVCQGYFIDFHMEAGAINDLNQVVGISMQNDPYMGPWEVRAFLFNGSTGTTIHLGFLNHIDPWYDGYSQATDVNAGGDVVGLSGADEFGSVSDLRGFYWFPDQPNGQSSAQGMQEIPGTDVQGNRPHRINAINNNRHIVGSIDSVATLWEWNGAGYNPPVDLTQYLGPGWTLSDATDINNAGQIVVIGQEYGVGKTMLLTP